MSRKDPHPPLTPCFLPMPVRLSFPPFSLSENLDFCLQKTEWCYYGEVGGLPWWCCAHRWRCCARCWWCRTHRWWCRTHGWWCVTSLQRKCSRTVISLLWKINVATTCIWHFLLTLKKRLCLFKLFRIHFAWPWECRFQSCLEFFTFFAFS